MRLDLPGRAGRQRLGLAVALSLLLHAALVAVAVTTGVVRLPNAPPPAKKALQWVNVVPVAPAPPLDHRAAPTLLRAAVPRTDPVPSGGNAPAVAAQAPSAVTEAEPRMALENPTSLPGVAAQPRPGASSPQPAPVPWDSEGIARALQQERTWQRRQGIPTAQALAPASGVHLREGISVHESVGGDGSRVSRVQGPAGTYCVRVPSANRLPEHGPAPRLAPVTNCP